MAIPYSRTIFLNIPWYSVLIVTGMILAVFLGEMEQKRKNLPADTVLDAVLRVIPCGIIGARLYYVAMRWDIFRHDLLSILYIWEGGLAIYGGVIAGALAVFLFSRRKKLSCLKLLDCLAPGLILAQAIGRWGNYFNMEAYGPEIHNPFFRFFPLGVLIPSQGQYVWHMSTFFYESMWNLAGFLLLWMFRKRPAPSGTAFFAYLVWYGSGRIIIEGLRQDSLYIGSIRVSQLLSLLLCLTGSMILLWRMCRRKDKPFLLSLGSMLCLLGRWLCLSNAPLYGGLALAGLLFSLAVLLPKRRSGAILCLAGLFIADAAALCAWLLFPALPNFLFGLHQLVCSLSFCAMVALLCRTLHTNDNTKELCPCPSES